MMLQSTGMLFAITAWALIQLVTHVKSLAIFETHVIAFTNPTNSIATGQCCQNTISSLCNSSCLTFFEVCLDDLHLKDANCIFGKNRSKLFHTSSLTKNETRLERSIPISTSQAWPGIFGLRLSAIDNSTRTSASKGLIQQTVFVDIITPGNNWKTKNESGSVSSILYRYRVKCAPNYFGQNCTIYCKPRDDDYGHYGCDVNGNRYCLHGWNDITDYCRKPICNETCQHGRCTGPNICSCNQGWIGSLCSTCRTRVGCVNGTCIVPGTCDCNGGWGGPNCDKEMDYCGMHRPCQNGGTCINNGLGKFRCYCRPTYTGQRCETAITACTVNPCQNGGSCEVVGSGYKCICRPEYTGVQCGTGYDPCGFFHCQNNGTCNTTNGQPFCNCSKGFTGQRCETILQLTTSQSFGTYSTESASHAIHSIGPSDGLSFVYSSTPLSILLSSYQPEITESTPRLNAVRSSDIEQAATSVSSYQAEWNFTHSNLEHSYTVYSQAYSVLSQSSDGLFLTLPNFSPNQTVLVRKDSRSLIMQRTRSSASLVMTKHLQSSRYKLRSTVSSNPVLSHTVSRPLNVSVFSTRTVQMYRNHTAVFRRNSISPRFNEESKTIMPTGNAEVEQSATSIFYNQFVLSTDVVSPSASSVLSVSIFASTVPKTIITRTQYQGSSRRSIAIGISVAISFLIIMIIGLTFLWVKFSKKRGHHKFRTASTIAPESGNNPCKLLDAVLAQKSSSINTSARGESTSSTSEKSQAVSSKDININGSCLQMHPRIDSKASYFNNSSSYSNFGYLSEGTSGYESENSSGRSSANLSNLASKSPVNTNDIIVSRCSTNKGPSGNLPNCIAYLEEYQEVEL